MKPEMSMSESLYLVEDKEEIMKILSKNNVDTDVLVFFFC